MDKYEEMTFGKYIETKRKERGKTLRSTAFDIGVSPPFYSEVEKDRRSPLTLDKLEQLALALHLNQEDTFIMYDKAAQASKRVDTMVPKDIPDYIMDRSYVLAALRLAKEVGAGEKEWQVLVDELKSRKEK